MIVAVLIERESCVLGIVVVSQEVVVAFGDELADAVGIRIEDLNVTARQRQACRVVLEELITVQSKDRCALCKAVALNALEAHGLEKCKDLRIYGSAAQDDESHPAAEDIVDRLEELAPHRNRKMQSFCELHACLEFLSLLGVFLKSLLDLLVEELEHYWNHEDTCRSYFLKVLCDVAQAFADTYCRASIDLAQEAACAFIGVMKRQH